MIKKINEFSIIHNLARLKFMPILALFLSLAASAYADEVYLKNKDRITGEVISEDDEIISLKTEMIGTLSIKKNDIERIARTEINSAANWGHAEGAKSISANTGLRLDKTWMAVADNRTRDTHSRIDGETVRDDETFSNGLRFPGDPMGPSEEIIQCRCTFAHTVIE